MKRRLTLAFGCLACAVPSMASASAPALRPMQVAAVESRRLTLLGATQVAQNELEQRGLASAHTIASVVLLRGVTPDSGHYDVRIDPPARLADGLRLRGFNIAIDGAIEPVTGFRAMPVAAALLTDAHFKSDKSEAPFSTDAPETPDATSPFSTP